MDLSRTIQNLHDILKLHLSLLATPNVRHCAVGNLSNLLFCSDADILQSCRKADAGHKFLNGICSAALVPAKGFVEQIENLCLGLLVVRIRQMSGLPTQNWRE